MMLCCLVFVFIQLMRSLLDSISKERFSKDLFRLSSLSKWIFTNMIHGTSLVRYIYIYIIPSIPTLISLLALLSHHLPLTSLMFICSDPCQSWEVQLGRRSGISTALGTGNTETVPVQTVWQELVFGKLLELTDQYTLQMVPNALVWRSLWCSTGVEQLKA